ncbi:uncharacterized protein LOC144446861 [Glandiceps talaboti]
MQADVVNFYTDCEPSGQWWEEAKQISTLNIINYTMPTQIFDQHIKSPEHAADVARLQILLDSGGVYLDTDAIVVNSLEHLRHYDFVIGQPGKSEIGNGIILSVKHSEFLKIFYDTYRDYKPNCFVCNSGYSSFEVVKQYPQFVHIEHKRVVEWNAQRLFYGHYPWWNDRYTVHAWIRAFREQCGTEIRFTSENIKYLDTSYGEICRYVYYGSRQLYEGSISNYTENEIRQIYACGKDP